MKVKVTIQMYFSSKYQAIVDKKEFENQLFNCDFCDINFVTINDMNLNEEVKINPKYVAHIEFEEVKE